MYYLNITSFQLSEDGPPHDKVFRWSCEFQGYFALGSGKSKKEAKMNAAKSVQDQLNIGESYERFVFKRTLVKNQSQSEMIKVML